MQFISPDSYWLNSTGLPSEYPPLSGDIEVDVAIIGAGITGLTAADFLKRRGMQVAVIEAGRVGSGTSGGTSAHLDNTPEVGAEKLISAFGEEAARKITLGRTRAIKIISDRCHEFGGCEFERVSAYAYTRSRDGVSSLQSEMEACSRIGLKVAAVKEIGLPFTPEFAIEFPDQARFHPVAYLRGLARSVHGDGSAIYEQTRAKVPSGGSTPELQTERGTVKAKAVIIATHSAYLGISAYDTRVSPYQSYCIAARTEQPAGDGLYWDDQDPYHYTRRAVGSDPHFLVIGGEDHKTGQGDPGAAFAALENFARINFGNITIERRWSAELFNSTDGLPFVGHVPLMKNVYLATGFGGEGLTYGTMAGELLSDLVLGHDNMLGEILSPARVKPIAAAKEFVKENLNVGKEFVTGHLAKHKINSLDEIPVGEGRVGSYKDQHLAIYHAPDGKFHACDPTCTHAGCIVNWNSSSKTWDCPCHGGRYAAMGERIYGPPPIDLKRAHLPTESDA